MVENTVALNENLVYECLCQKCSCFRVLEVSTPVVRGGRFGLSTPTIKENCHALRKEVADKEEDGDQTFLVFDLGVK